MPASVLLNADVCGQYPQIVEAIVARGWPCVAHGQNNSIPQTAMEEAVERAYLEQMTETIAAGTGRRPRGWLGPAMTETLNTPRLLAELGYSYVLDWCNDDQPYPLDIDGMISVPYSVELNDITLFVNRSYTGPEYVRMVKDQLEQLLADSQTSGRVMALPIHPFVVNQPLRHRYLAEALGAIASHDEVWITTSDAIAEHFAATRGADR
jgi:peptidoglycan/xylan/chitin deacetylase (PgdA/CDA1 family)